MRSEAKGHHTQKRQKARIGIFSKINKTRKEWNISHLLPFALDKMAQILAMFDVTSANPPTNSLTGSHRPHKSQPQILLPEHRLSAYPPQNPEHGPQIQHSSPIALLPVSIMSASHRIGQRVSYDGALCTVRFVGDVADTAGTWLGVEWDDATRGKHDGCHKGVRYFSCNSPSGRALFLLCSVCLTDMS